MQLHYYEILFLKFFILAIVKFIYSEKATRFSKISTVDLSYVKTVKSKVEISQIFAAFSECMNFILKLCCKHACSFRKDFNPMRVQCSVMIVLESELFSKLDYSAAEGESTLDKQ